jgi:hypothetical protein
MAQCFDILVKLALMNMREELLWIVATAEDLAYDQNRNGL